MYNKIFVYETSVRYKFFIYFLIPVNLNRTVCLIKFPLLFLELVSSKLIGTNTIIWQIMKCVLSKNRMQHLTRAIGSLYRDRVRCSGFDSSVERRPLQSRTDRGHPSGSHSGII